MENQAIIRKAFGKQSVVFDKIYDSNPIVSYMRNLIRKQVLSGINANDHIFEINAGTGTDAIFFAQAGYRVTALEISPKMVNQARKKIKKHELAHKVTFIQKSFEDSHQVEGLFDYVYSNFGGLNCTPNLVEVVHQLLDKLKPGGKATLTILPPITLWEKLFALKGDFKIATRRKLKGASIAHIEGEYFNCWYYNPNIIKNALRGQIKDVTVKGLCIFAPPSFMKTFPIKYPRTFKVLIKLDSLICKLPLFNRIGDYFIISFTKI